MRLGSPAVMWMPASSRRLASGFVLDDELDFEAGQQDLVEHPDDQLVLTDREALHRTARGRPNGEWGMGVTPDFTAAPRIGLAS